MATLGCNSCIELMVAVAVAPMRGRGFGRGMNTNRGDMFRSRPPNTSRPPSMHVDDYIKMEMQGQGSSSSSMPPPSVPPLSNEPRRMEVHCFLSLLTLGLGIPSDTQALYP